MLKGIKTKAVLIRVSRIWWVKNPLKATKTLHVIKIEVDIFLFEYLVKSFKLSWSSINSMTEI